MIVGTFYDRQNQVESYLVLMGEGSGTGCARLYPEDYADYQRSMDALGVVRQDCSWCKRIIRQGALPVSHGICVRCAANTLREYVAQGGAL